jgi:hypothetical protein
MAAWRLGAGGPQMSRVSWVVIILSSVAMFHLGRMYERDRAPSRPAAEESDLPAPSSDPGRQPEAARPSDPAPSARPAHDDVTDTLPSVFVGNWGRNRSACASGRKGTKLRIEADRIHFPNVQASVKSVGLRSPRFISVSATLGARQRQDTINMTLSRNFQAVTIDGIEYLRC